MGKDLSATGCFLIPNNTNGISCTEWATAYTYGSFSQMIASTSAEMLVTHIIYRQVGAGTSIQDIQVCIGTGSAGSEVSKGEFKGVGYRDVIQLPRPLLIPASTRVAAKIMTDVGTGVSAYVTLACVPTANLTNPVLDDVETPEGTVQTDAGNTSTTFKTNLSGPTDYCKDMFLTFKSATTTANLRNQTKKVTAFNTSTSFVTVEGGFSQAPANTDTFDLINR